MLGTKDFLINVILFVSKVNLSIPPSFLISIQSIELSENAEKLELSNYLYFMSNSRTAIPIVYIIHVIFLHTCLIRKGTRNEVHVWKVCSNGFCGKLKSCKCIRSIFRENGRIPFSYGVSNDSIQ